MRLNLRLLPLMRLLCPLKLNLSSVKSHWLLMVEAGSTIEIAIEISSFTFLGVGVASTGAGTS
jgi:hypothetical protein